MKLTMLRLIITLTFALPLSTTVYTVPARADWVQMGVQWSDDKGNMLGVFYNEDTNQFLFWRVYGDGRADQFIFMTASGDNPYNDATGPGSHSDKPDVIGLLKSGAASYTVKIAPSDSSELMKFIEANGGGLGPHHNPGDQDTGKGPGKAPTHSMTVNKTKKEIDIQIQAFNEVAKLLQSIEGSMGDVGEGGTENAPGVKPHDGKGKVDTTGNYTEGQNKLVGKTEKDLLGAKPDVINPPHLNKVGKSTATIKHLTTTDTNKGSGKTLSVTGAGLLDDGGGVGQNGPAGTGSPASGGHIYHGTSGR